MEKNNRRSITCKQNIGGQSSLHASHCHHLIYIPITFHEDIPTDYQVMGCTKMKITQNKHTKKRKGHNS